MEKLCKNGREKSLYPGAIPDFRKRMCSLPKSLLVCKMGNVLLQNSSGISTCIAVDKKLRQKAQIYFTGSAGQQRVGKEFLEGLTLPDIPISSKNRDEITQEKIIDHMAQLSEQIKELRLEAEKLRRAARHEFEEEVFGKEKKEKEIG